MRSRYIKVIFIVSSIFLSGCFLKANIASMNSESQKPVVEKPTFSISLASDVVTKTSTDQNIASYVTVTLSKELPDVVTISLVPDSTEANASDFEIASYTLQFQPGETSKTVKLTVKGRVGSKEYDKVVKLKASSSDSVFSEPLVEKSFTIKDSNPLSLTVSPFYATLGTNWNSYIASSTVRIITPYLRVGPDQFPAESICTGGFGSCIHAGEIKKVIVSSRKSCANLTMQDSENAFEWRCADTTAPAYFYSVGFKKSKGLKDFILTAGTDWKNLSITLYENGQPLGSSTATKWWPNSVVLYDSTNINSGGGDGRLTLGTADAIYVFKGTLQSRGIDLSADGVAMVTLPGSSVSSTSPFATGDCDSTSLGNQLCFIGNQIKSRIWIEGTYTGLANQTLYRMESFSIRPSGVRFHGAQLSVGNILLQTYTTAGDSYTDSKFLNAGMGIYNGANVYSNYIDLVFQNVAAGLSTGYTSMYGRLLNIKVKNDNSVSSLGLSFDGLLLAGSQIQIANNETGITGAAMGGIVVNSTANFNQTGVDTSSSAYISLVNFTAFGNTAYGIRSVKTNSRSFNQVLSANNDIGFHLSGAGGTNRFSLVNSASIDNTTDEIVIGNSGTHVYFGEKLFIGRNVSPCAIGTGTSNIGFTNTNCDADSSGTFSVTAGLDANTIVQGFTNDTVNSRGMNGLLGELFSNITDWFSFENWNRNWTPYSAGSLPNATVRGTCASGNCGIYETKIKAGSHGFKNFNGTFVAGAACPSRTKGSKAVMTYANPNVTALQGVSEFLFDGIGNDNGLCEASETCYFTPDLGANFFDLQSLNQTCIYDADGSVLTGITIYGQ